MDPMIRDVNKTMKLEESSNYTLWGDRILMILIQEFFWWLTELSKSNFITIEESIESSPLVGIACIISIIEWQGPKFNNTISTNAN